jgi:hypothetical protein
MIGEHIGQCASVLGRFACASEIAALGSLMATCRASTIIPPTRNVLDHDGDGLLLADENNQLLAMDIRVGGYRSGRSSCV